eukprot:Colp12_sorted_trinity150504_noHs@22117
MANNKVMYITVKIPTMHVEKEVDVERPNVSQSLVYREALYKAANVTKEYVIKLRNHRGSIIPINTNIPYNSPDDRFTLEVTHPFENVTPLPPMRKNESTPDKDIQAMVNNFLERLAELETKASGDYVEKVKEKTKQELKNITQRLDLVEQKLEGAEKLDWQGTFKRHPLW